LDDARPANTTPAGNSKSAIAQVNAFLWNRILRGESTPTEETPMLNGVTVAAQQPLDFALEADAVLFGSGMGDGNKHSNSDLPIILAGGGYKHGEFRQVPKTGVNKVRLCNLFVDIAQKMGVEIDSFGNSTSRFS
jgi:hypothetical protein